MSSDPNVYMVWFWICFAAGVVIAVVRWATHQLTPPPQVPLKSGRTKAEKPHIPDEDALAALIALGFNRTAALAALNASGWQGASLEERVTRALRTHPNYAANTRLYQDKGG